MKLLLNLKSRLVYNMCYRKPPSYSYASQLYDKYKEALDEYINSTVRSINFLSYATVFLESPSNISYHNLANILVLVNIVAYQFCNLCLYSLLGSACFEREAGC